MKTSQKAFTLVEFLLVAAILVIFSILLLPTCTGSRRAPVAKAKLEMSALFQAITAYETAYGRFPVSAAIEPATTTNSLDFTFGSTLGLPSAPMPIGTMVGGRIISNAEVIAILTRNPELKWPRCDKMLEQKRFGKIEAIPKVVW